MTDAQTDAVRSTFFDDLTGAERSQLAALLEPMSFAKGDTILREGKSTQFLWVVTKGKCEVFKTCKRGNEQVLATLEPGAVFGEMSFFVPGPHSASVRSLTQSKVMRLSRENFDLLHKRCPEAAYKVVGRVITVLAERMRKMDTWLAELDEQTDAAPHREEWLEFRSKLYADWQF